jgi:iron complex transport system ATP-binding protein
MMHEAHRNKLIHLIGDGFEYLWTKNALERNGFAVTPSESGITIKIELGTQPCVWVMNNQRYTSIQGLLKYLCD